MLRSKELHTKTCKKCNKTFRTDKPKAYVCLNCQRKSKYAIQQSLQSERRKIEKFHRTIPDTIPLREYTAIIKRYNDMHGTSYSYGYFELMRFLGKITNKDLEECAT